MVLGSSSSSMASTRFSFEKFRSMSVLRDPMVRRQAAAELAAALPPSPRPGTRRRGGLAAGLDGWGGCGPPPSAPLPRLRVGAAREWTPRQGIQKNRTVFERRSLHSSVATWRTPLPANLRRAASPTAVAQTCSTLGHGGKRSGRLRGGGLFGEGGFPGDRGSGRRGSGMLGIQQGQEAGAGPCWARADS
eukprot:353643-Chlamydomonas_euryale.AAC.6